MSFTVTNLKKTWIRFCSTISRKPYFIRNNLVMGPRRPNTIRRILWGYFNAPGNVMFVTTNVISFAALVTYNTIINIQHDRILEQEMMSGSHTGQTIVTHENETLDNIPTKVSIFLPFHQNTTFTEIKDTVVKEIPKGTNSPKQVVEDEVTEIVDTPFIKYLEGDVKLTKNVPVNSIKSLIAKSSLFSLVYYYHLYEDIVYGESKRNSNEREVKEDGSNKYLWNRRIQRLRSLNLPLIKYLQNDDNSLTIFYQIWNKENKKNLKKYDSLYEFKFPRWTLFPNSLSRLCIQLHDNKVETLSDFQRLYDLSNRSTLRKLFRLWLYDYSNLLNRTNNNALNETMFNRLIRDSFNDKDFDSFKKFSSIILNPVDERSKLFFTIRPDYQSYQIHLDTLLTILQKYIFLQKDDVKGRHNYDMEILRMVQLIKNNGYLDKNGSAHILLQQDHPPFSESDRKRYFESLSSNKRVGEILQEVATLQKTSHR